VCALPSSHFGKEGRSEGRREGRKEGRKEGRTDGRKEGRKEGGPGVFVWERSTAAEFVAGPVKLVVVVVVVVVVVGRERGSHQDVKEKNVVSY
jgi:predicted transposase YdaD